jgi:hypothetical protein
MKMINNFQNKYGEPEETTYDKGNYNMKGKEPVICKIEEYLQMLDIKHY